VKNGGGDEENMNKYLDKNILHLKKQGQSYQSDQHDRSKSGPTDKLSMSLRATWTSVDLVSV
jgi:hypothetical protein